MVDLQFPHIKCLGEYTDVLVRNCNILDSFKLGNTMHKILAKYQNFELRTGAKIKSYSLEDTSKHVTHINLEDGSSIECDIVVLCTGPQTPFHLWKHFKTVLPQMAG